MKLSNPNYGVGVFRRRIRIEEYGEPGGLLASLEDGLHGFRLFVRFEDGHLVEVNAEVLRAPYDICPSAISSLQLIVGVDVDEIANRLHKHSQESLSCTHLHDLLRLTAHHVLSGKLFTQYDVLVPDQINETQKLFVYEGGVLVHEWEVSGNRICAPGRFKGFPLMRGFFEWVFKTFSGRELLAATVLQRGFLVSFSRRFDMDAMERSPMQSPARIGACYTFSTEMAPIAKGSPNVVRDFTNRPEKLLTFE